MQKFNKLALAQCRGTKMSRRQKIVKVQDFNCEHLRVSGCMNHKKFVLGAGAKAKSVTIQLTYIDRVSNRAILKSL